MNLYSILSIQMQDSRGKKEPFWKRRHIIVVHTFFVFFLLNSHRISLSVALVAMVDYPGHENLTVEQISKSPTTSQLSHKQASSIAKYDWNPKTQGYILGAGFLGTVLSLILGGKLAETFGPRIILLLGTGISSISTTVTPFAASIDPYFVVFIQCVRGIAQGFMSPAAAVLSANWFPRFERGFLSGLSFSGSFLGFSVAGIVTSLICNSICIGGWPSAFYIFGGFGIFVTLLQLISLKSLPKDDPRISTAELMYILENQESEFTIKRPDVPWGEMLRSMPTYALLVALFGQYWIVVHFLSVHATFLTTILYYPIAQNGALVSSPYVLSLFCSVSSSFISSFLTAKNYLSTSGVRKLWNFISSLMYSICLSLMILTNSESTVTVFSSIIGIGCTGFITSGAMLVALDMTPTFSGSLTGLSTTIASFAGFLLPVTCGFLTNEEQTIQRWNIFFIINIAVAMSSAIFFCIFGSSEIQSYNSPADDLSHKNEKETNDSKIAVLRNKWLDNSREFQYLLLKNTTD